ncbi:hypothetical protein DBT_2302 [Dissulfuribacter thermophilus]|uniref:Uncharacterized protein n=1 Tax=Dissulfuribacter thermophilus TaxID=1156395 RepID=A0A1B9F369_9BACT|nr:hypothetical protein DBT_2302 [Dissulfuribacter thermophilus]
MNQRLQVKDFSIRLTTTPSLQFIRSCNAIKKIFLSGI